LEDRLDFKIRFLFQPGEERLPGGASLMIRDNVLEGVATILGEHVHPDLPVGKVGYREAYFMASCDELFIDILGRGGHAATPHRLVDPIATSAAVIQALQTVISRNANPVTPAVLSIGKINSEGGATNVIPDVVSMEGTFRTFDESWRYEAHERIKDLIHSVSASFGAKAIVRIEKGYPALYNHPDLTSKARDGMIEYLGSENVIRLDPRMTAEDFSYYSQAVPACFYRLGTSSPDGNHSHAVHTSQFDIDESALETGMGLMSWLSLSL
jgi:amidohydrolase